MLYRLSYGLRAACVGAGLRPVNSGPGGFRAGVPQVPIDPADGTPLAELALEMPRSGNARPREYNINGAKRLGCTEKQLW